ncbi:MAG: hypothetical protein E7058_00610 [Lentisphaerae bacterium]|nr:hypothetical protein [Lentisphaerota bacterium]
MKKYLLLFVLLASSDILFAGAYLGYLYPSGGQRGTTVRVIAGGQGLRGKITILCSNPGVKLKSAAVVPNMGYFPGQQRTWLINYLKNIYAGKNGIPPYPEKKDEQGWRKNSFLEKLADLPPLERSIVAHSVYVRINSLQAAPAISGRVILDLEISPDAPTGPCRLRLVSGRSISNEKLFFIDSDRQIIEPLYTPPFLPAPALEPVKELPAVLNGQIMPGETDVYTVFLQGDKSYSFTMRAAELSPYLGDSVPGHFQGTLTLRDSSGREVAFADDEFHHPDPVLRFTPQLDGFYTLHVSDSIKRGRADFVYRVEVTDKTEPFRPYHNVSDYIKREKSFNIGMTSYVEVSDDSVDISGVLNPLHYITTKFVVHARKGERKIFEVFAARLDSPLDSVLTIRNMKGQVIAENDDIPTGLDLDLNRRQTDSKIDVTFPETGSYLIELSPRTRLTGREGFYTLQIRPPEPSLTAASGSSVLELNRQGVGKMRFHIQRKDGFAGDVTITSPQLVPVGKNQIAAGENFAELSFKVTAPPRKSQIIELQIYAEYTVNGKKYTVPVIPAEETMQAFAYTHLLAAEKFYCFTHPAPTKEIPVRKKQIKKAPAKTKKKSST